VALEKEEGGGKRDQSLSPKKERIDHGKKGNDDMKKRRKGKTIWGKIKFHVRENPGKKRGELSH